MSRPPDAPAAQQPELLGEPNPPAAHHHPAQHAYPHDEDEQRKLAEDQIPEHVREAIQH
jgi:hypothetical protein